jgi:hypothetical protein
MRELLIGSALLAHATFGFVSSAQYEMRLRPSWRNQSRPYLRGVPTWSSHVPARYMCTKWPQRRVRFEKLRSQELPTLNRRQRDR